MADFKIYTACRVNLTRLNRFIEKLDRHYRDKAAEHVAEFMQQPTEEEYQAVLVKLKRCEVNVECGLRIWVRSKYAYIIPFGACGAYWRPYRYARNFAYWGNPKGMKNTAWHRRGRIWEKILVGGTGSAHQLVHETVSLTDSMFVMKVKDLVAKRNEKTS